MEWTDTAVEERMGRVLQVGVAIAAVVVFAGGVIYLLRHGGEKPAYGTFHGVAVYLTTASGIIWAAIAKRGGAIIQLGILLMIATPVMRVIFAVFAFAREKDWLYTGVSLFVLAVLSYSLFLAR